jgi:protein involved in polysaccharide export with SLBB domain
MERGGDWPWSRRSLRLWLPLLQVVLAGCAADRSHLNQALLADRDAAHRRAVSANYLVGFPDVLSISIHNHPQISGLHEVGADGRIDLGELGRLRIEGKSSEAIMQLLALSLNQPAESIQVHVAEYRSQHVNVVGQVSGSQRAVVYRGPETVLELLRRAGGISKGAEPDLVYVVRAQIVEGGKPELYRVDLRAILFYDDAKSNIVVQPGDEIFIGERASFSFERCIAPWLRPIYEALSGLRPDPKTAERKAQADSLNDSLGE